MIVVCCLLFVVCCFAFVRLFVLDLVLARVLVLVRGLVLVGYAL